MQLNQTKFCPMSSVRTNTFSSTDVRISKKKYRECLSRGWWWSWSLSWGFKFPYGSWGRWILRITRRDGPAAAESPPQKRKKPNQTNSQPRKKSNLSEKRNKNRKLKRGLIGEKKQRVFLVFPFRILPSPRALSLCGLHLSYISHLHTLSLFPSHICLSRNHRTTIMMILNPASTSAFLKPQCKLVGWPTSGFCVKIHACPLRLPSWNTYYHWGTCQSNEHSDRTGFRGLHLGKRTQRRSSHRRSHKIVTSRRTRRGEHVFISVIVAF